MNIIGIYNISYHHNQANGNNGRQIHRYYWRNRQIYAHFFSSSPLFGKNVNVAFFFFFKLRFSPSLGVLGRGLDEAGDASLCDVDLIGGAGGLSSSAIFNMILPSF